MSPKAPPANETEPTRWQAALFIAKSNGLRLRRWFSDARVQPPALRAGSGPAAGPLIAESRSPLYSSAGGAEFALQAGKVQNLRVAAHCLDGRVLQAGELFSFWANVPRPTTGRGFSIGRELRSGCVIPSVGGGLCQLSNALYDVALTASCEIVERHAHSRTVPGSAVMPGRDATIFWNYVDLRFRARFDCQLEVELTRDELRVRMRAPTTPNTPCARVASAVSMFPAASPPIHVESCETCGVVSCFRHSSATNFAQNGSTAWLVDAWMPEHDAYMVRERKREDTLLTPLDRSRWNAGPYRWTSDGFASVHSAPGFVLKRSLLSRRSRGEGAERQRALLQMDAELAELHERHISATATHLVISQNLLPFLWKRGVLGGRTFDVLMTRLPFVELQRQLDRAGERWPGTRTLEDFRAGAALVDAESAALAEARHWITPHIGIAALGGSRSLLMEWQRPFGKPSATTGGSRLIFPASTLSRKGARELREALKGLDVMLTLGGAVIEQADFWKGIRTMPPEKDWLADAAAVVLPAWVEHQPRRLLAALARGVPVICTPACGLPPQPGLTIVPEGDSGALRASIQTSMMASIRNRS